MSRFSRVATGPAAPPALPDDYVRSPSLLKATAARRDRALLLRPAARPALVVRACICVNVSFIQNRRVRGKAFM